MLSKHGGCVRRVEPPPLCSLQSSSSSSRRRRSSSAWPQDGPPALRRNPRRRSAFPHKAAASPAAVCSAEDLPPHNKAQKAEAEEVGGWLVGGEWGGGGCVCRCRETINRKASSRLFSPSFSGLPSAANITGWKYIAADEEPQVEHPSLSQRGGVGGSE